MEEKVYYYKSYGKIIKSEIEISEFIVNDYVNDDNVDIVVVGTADKSVLEREDFLRLVELKEAGARFALMKDFNFVKGLITRGFVQVL